jgi:hypothetical protein
MPSSGWYSKKFNKAALAYELGIAIYHNKLVWINGPFPAGKNDKKIFNKPTGSSRKFQTGVKVLVTRGTKATPTNLPRETLLLTTPR